MEEETFFDRLKFRREKIGLNQKALSKIMGVSTNTIQSWERDVYPKGDAILLLSDTLQCSVEWLLKGKSLSTGPSLPIRKDPEFGRRLQEARGVNKYTQDFVAELLNVNVDTIRRYENGELPSETKLLTLSDIMRCSIDWLLTGEGQPPRGHEFDETVPSVLMPNGVRIEDSNVVELRHIDVIKDFEDKPYALELNSDLLALEKLNPSAYRKVGSYIKGVADGVRMSSVVDDKSKVG